MDWQRIAALSVIAVTAGLFIWSNMRRRKFSFQRHTHCGCAAPSSGGGGSILFTARKGERSRIIMKAN
jgi:hypothetical protein